MYVYVYKIQSLYSLSFICRLLTDIYLELFHSFFTFCIDTLEFV